MWKMQNGKMFHSQRFKVIIVSSINDSSHILFLEYLHQKKHIIQSYNPLASRKSCYDIRNTDKIALISSLFLLDQRETF